MARLVVVEGKGAGTVRAELTDGPCVVGRLASCGLQLDEPQSSRKHFQLERRGAGWAVVDLGSKNGTLLNEDRVEGEAPLRDGDRLRVGDTVVAYEEAPLPPGTRLGGVELREALGRAEHGTLYAARQGSLERAVLVEVAAPHVAADPAARRRFEARAKTAGSVEHPALLAVLDTGEGGGRVWTVFEQPTGASLAERFARGPAFDRDAAVAVVRELALALTHVHAKGLVHGLVGPGVVHVDAQGHVKLGGLGEPPGARLRRHRPDLAEQARYASPEEARGGDPTAASDVYSLGALAVHLLVGAPPFDGPPRDVLAEHAADDPVPLPAGLDEALRDVLGRCLAKDPAERPDAPALERALLAWGRRGAARDAGRDPSERRRNVDSGRRGLADSGRRPADPGPRPGASSAERRAAAVTAPSAPAAARRDSGRVKRGDSARQAALLPPDLVPLRVVLLGLGYALIALATAVGARIALRLL